MHLSFPSTIHLFCLVCFHVETIWGLTTEQLTVNLDKFGTIVGFVDKTVPSKREFASFQGIPYAKAEKRFSPAKPVDTLPAGFDAKQKQTACYQPPSGLFPAGTVYTEDCLTLNVYTPKVDASKLLPVIVFIHGGAFVRWSGNLYNGRRLLERDIVLVSINYRINVFGFLSLENDDAPGNLGLYDQVLALKWVQKYITNFGGDNNLITVAGESAGAASVTYMLDNPLAQNLFHRAIASSGDAVVGWAIQPDPIQNAFNLANSTTLNCADSKQNAKGQDWDKVLQCLRGKSAEDIITASAAFFFKTPRGEDNSREKKYDSDAMVYAGLQDKPVGLFDSLITLYFGSSQNSGKFDQMANGLVDLFSVFYFKGPAYQRAIYHSSVNPATYLYSFEYYGAQTFYNYTGGVAEIPRGVTHVDDLMYLFDYKAYTKGEDKYISKFMVDNWVNFATTGDPNGKDSKSKWPKFSMDTQKFLKINTKPEVGSNYNEYWVGTPSPSSPLELSGGLVLLITSICGAKFSLQFI